MTVLTREHVADLPASTARRLLREQRAARMVMVPDLKMICERCGHFYERVRDWFEEQPGEHAAEVAATENLLLDWLCCDLLGRPCCGRPDRVEPTHAAMIAALHGGDCPEGRWGEVLAGLVSERDKP